MNELKYKRSPGDDTRPSRQEISTNNSFQYGRLSRGLGSNDDNLRKIDRVAPNGVERVLQLVDKSDEITVH